jgi:hypothetical protein
MLQVKDCFGACGTVKFVEMFDGKAYVRFEAPVRRSLAPSLSCLSIGSPCLGVCIHCDPIWAASSLACSVLTETETGTRRGENTNGTTEKKCARSLRVCLSV